MTEHITNTFSSWPRPAAVIYLHSCGTNKNGWLLTEGHLPRVQCVSLSQCVCLWLLLCFCSRGYVRVGFCICPPVHACLKCPCLDAACQRSYGCWKRGVCTDQRCQKWHCDIRHCNECWHSNLGDCDWSSRFDYNFVLLCQGIVDSGVRLTPLLWSGFAVFKSLLTLAFFFKE